MRSHEDRTYDSMYFNAQIELSSNVRFLALLRQLNESLALELGWSANEAMKIKLAVDEALTNKVRHAYDNRTDGRIILNISTVAEGIEFRLSDQGAAPDGSKICARDKESAQASGMGTHIIRDVMDDVAYTSSDGRNLLILTKKRPLPGSLSESKGEK